LLTSKLQNNFAASIKKLQFGDKERSLVSELGEGWPLAETAIKELQAEKSELNE
jgi:hypothetical protein